MTAPSTQSARRSPKSRGKVLVAMSGGVDSSVVAALLQDEGYEVVGCFMRLGSDDSVEAAEGYDNLACRDPKPHQQGCCSVNDAADARHVAALLGVPFYVMNFKRDFGRVIDYFVDEYNAGRTPNPCVRCNDWLKFGKLHDYAQSIDCDFVASGHYARIVKNGINPSLCRGRDHHKDQSYVLFGTPRHQLAHMMLPIGDIDKTDVRQIAADRGLPVFDKPDSQEICFVPDNDYARLVARRSPDAVTPGNIIDTDGQIVGRHEGHQHFTIGQRRGVGVALGYPIYVTHRDAATNTVTVGRKQDLLAQGCIADQTNWLLPQETLPHHWTACQVKVRYNSQPAPARVRITPGSGDDSLEVAFDEPMEAVTPGQAVVCYDGDTVMGGGWICHALR